MSAKFELERFDGKGDFGLWRKKMKALLVQQKVAKAIEDPKRVLATMTEEEREEMAEIAYITVILYLSDSVLRRVSEIDNVVELWAKLEELYMVKSLTNKIYLKERFFGYQMDPTKGLEENLDEFNTICTQLANTGEKIEPENQAVILLNSLPETYREVKSVSTGCLW